MPAGVWLWDEQGRPIVDTTTSIATIVGTTSASSPFTITNPMFQRGIPWYFYIPRGVYGMVPGGGGTSGAGTPSVSFSGQTMSVNGSLFDGTFIYGIR